MPPCAQLGERPLEVGDGDADVVDARSELDLLPPCTQLASVLSKSETATPT